MSYSDDEKNKIVDDIIFYIVNEEVYLEEFKDNKEIALSVLKKEPYGLTYLSSRLKNDKDIILEAVKQDSILIMFASSLLKDDKDVVLEAVKNDSTTLRYASERLQNDKDLLEVLEKTDPSSYLSSLKKWYEERMEVLANIREKEIMENSIIASDRLPKRVKF